jgi:hypothetical protein
VTANSLTFNRLGAILLFVAIGLAACLMPAQNDTWWHLRSGEQTWESGAVQLHDTFSHTVSGAYWPNQEWLSEVVFYGVYRAGGLPLLTALVALLVVATWLVVWRLTPGALYRRLGLCGAAVVSCAPEWSLRPKAFTLLLLALTALLLSRRRFMWLPALFLLWANLHGGVVLGLVAVASAAAVSVVERRSVRTPATLACLGCVAAVSCTPLGLSFWTEVPASIARIRQYDIQEWRAPSVFDPVFAPFWLIAAALIVLAVLVRPWKSRTGQQDLTFWAALALLPLAFCAARNVSAALILAVPALARLIETTFPAAAPRPRLERPWLNAALASAAASIAFAWVAYAWSADLARLAWHPVAKPALDAVASCPGELYNRYDDGGYLIWFAPTRKVFIDGRQDPYPPAMMHEHLRVERTGDYDSMFRRYSIGCAFLPTDAVVATRLRAAGWTTLYEDTTWAVLSRPR